jgi:hypothetical protein
MSFQCVKLRVARYAGAVSGWFHLLESVADVGGAGQLDILQSHRRNGVEISGKRADFHENRTDS